MGSQASQAAQAHTVLLTLTAAAAAAGAVALVAARWPLAAAWLRRRRLAAAPTPAAAAAVTAAELVEFLRLVAADVAAGGVRAVEEAIAAVEAREAARAAAEPPPPEDAPLELRMAHADLRKARHTESTLAAARAAADGLVRAASRRHAEARAFRPEAYFGTPAELLGRTHNRPRERQLLDESLPAASGRAASKALKRTET